MRFRNFSLEAIPEHQSISFDHYGRFSDIAILESSETKSHLTIVVILILMITAFGIFISQPELRSIFGIMFICIFIMCCGWSMCHCIWPNPNNPNDIHRGSITIIIDEQKNDEMC